ncbi:MAG: bifunctional aspartate kinase/homoserine dehydrogenase I [Bacteroidetes bacterium]|nr:bifunctional aspartate kinase/homoserine dehydrogenase I [Bacteroidota bacterium]
MNSFHWTVHKFGGTSVATSERIETVAAIIRKEQTGKTGVVVSAMSGVTDQLLQLLELASHRKESLKDHLDSLRKKHLDAIESLLPAIARTPLVAAIQSDFNDVEDILRGVWLTREYSPRTRDFVSGLGEVWNAQFLNAKLQSLGLKSEWLDARKILVVAPAVPTPNVLWEQSKKKLDSWFKEHKTADYIVITGFVAQTEDGIPTTLGRNGSDYSGSIFGNLFDAEKITIWTDVDGVMSANPKQVPGAVVVPELTYQEAVELAYFGAKVLHPSTMIPAMKKGIPLFIRNTFNPDHPGTRISSSCEQDPFSVIKGFSIVEKVALINVEGTGMLGVPGISSRLFTALHEKNISVILISQASSEHSICVAVPEAQAELAKATTEQAFFAELYHGKISSVSVENQCAVLAAVGDTMSGVPGVSAKFFGSLGKAGVNIRAIAQGSSERNISVVVRAEDATKALRAAHSGFYLSNQTLSVGIIGPGLVGTTLLNQIAGEHKRLKADFGIDIRVRGIMNSRKMVLSNAGISLNKWKQELESAELQADLDSFIHHVHADYFPHTVLIDCTSSQEIAGKYVDWLKRGIHVITPNKKANTMPYPYYQELKKEGKKISRHFLYETTVGAGLPIIGTLRDLIQTGDEIIRIEGVLSGTLGYLFSSFDGKTPFSELVRQAREKGYTEPDPRDDLSGTDVGRKVVILSREIGKNIELEEVPIRSLVPARLEKVSIKEFLDGYEEINQEIGDLYRKAAEKGEVLRYVGVIDPAGGSRVELRTYPATHPFAHIRGNDNIVAFTTKRYFNQPLIVQGPGAGPEVTAAGAFADLLRLSQYLGATL